MRLALATLQLKPDFLVMADDQIPRQPVQNVADVVATDDQNPVVADPNVRPNQPDQA